MGVKDSELRRQKTTTLHRTRLGSYFNLGSGVGKGESSARFGVEEAVRAGAGRKERQMGSATPSKVTWGDYLERRRAWTSSWGGRKGDPASEG